jgi:hypothetical protein
MNPDRRPPIILQLGPGDFAVAIRARNGGTVPVYRINQRDIKAASVAATLARQAEEAERG